MTQRGFQIDGYDINEKAVKRALNDGIIENQANSFQDYDYYIVCVSTHNPKNMLHPSLIGFFEVIEKLAKEGKHGSLVAIESTITKGASQKALTILNHRLHVAHAPHRFYCKDKIIHGINQPRVLGGCNNCCTAEALYFYEKLLGIPMRVVNKVELAELSKIIENSYRFLQIAFVEELKTYCDLNNLDFIELREAINTKWNINLLEALEGIGGHCLPKDSQMYQNLLNKKLPTCIIESAISADKTYKRHNQKLDSSKESSQISPVIIKRKIS
jgi:UDP-N-acetyl-D-mannosaminuronic acid dehydrogenase